MGIFNENLDACLRMDSASVNGRPRIKRMGTDITDNCLYIGAHLRNRLHQ